MKSSVGVKHFQCSFHVFRYNSLIYNNKNINRSQTYLRTQCFTHRPAKRTRLRTKFLEPRHPQHLTPGRTMPDTRINFDDAAAYELFMASWTRMAGAVFLDWLKPPPDRSWLDVGCGSGAFTELIAKLAAPASIEGIDPSQALIDFARTRPTLAAARFAPGDAMALPVADGSHDIAVMALVLFFVPEPARGVAEMRRVVRPGGTIAAYAWDILGGGFPIDAVQAELRRMGLTPALPPSAEASTRYAMQGLWQDAGLIDVETSEIALERRFDGFDDYWTMAMAAPGMRERLGTWEPDRLEGLKQGVRTRLGLPATGPIMTRARANAVKGRVPG